MRQVDGWMDVSRRGYNARDAILSTGSTEPVQCYLQLRHGRIKTYRPDRVWIFLT